MTVSQFAKKLSEELGKEIKYQVVVEVLADKKPGLKHNNGIDDDLMAYAREVITKGNNASNKADKPAPKKEVKKEEAKPAPKKEAKKEEAKPAPKKEAKKEEAKPAPKKNDKKQDNKPQNNQSQNNGGNQKQADAGKRVTKFFNQPNNKKKNQNNQNNQNNKNQNQAKPEQPKKQEPVEPVIKTLQLPESLTVSELASKIKVPVAQLIKKMFMAGKMYNVNSELDFDTAADIALEYNFISEPEEKVDVIEEILREDAEDESLMTPRPPVVCVMGHVDHGKTSLLDAIRNSDVTAGEAGGITQHIGASVVKINGEKITFLDTPGHEAFTAMRMRGAQSTDIAILVVAADDGVMPQTVEAINHAKAAGIEIIVAINKIDKESANIDRVKQELMEYELVPEDWGGSTIFCPVSAHTREGIDNLLEMVILTAEILELRANKKRKARGIVIEAQIDKGRGSVATVLVQKGTLHVGDCVAMGSVHGKGYV